MKRKLAECLSRDLDEHSVNIYHEKEPRWHLGASIIGGECWREIWYGFRWVYNKKFEGRLYRLFNRGHKEEFRFVEWLRGMGHAVEEFDPESRLYYHPESDSYLVGTVADAHEQAEDVTDEKHHEERAASMNIKRKQFRISDVMGHYGGSLDGKIKLSEIAYPGLPKMLLEFKTVGSKYFDALKRKGVMLDKPTHYAQMCSYGKRHGLHYALYMCVNKDTDEVYMEIVELNWNEADNMTVKAERIIRSQVPPPRISENSAFQKCKTCTFAGQCHHGKPYDINCRSCKNAIPVENGEWHCALYSQIIPRDFVPKACPQWSPAI